MTSLLLLSFAAIVSAGVASAGTLPAATFTASYTFNNVESNTLGWGFTIDAPIWVSALGYYDDSSLTSPTSGLLDNHIVGIFDSTGNLLTSTTVPAGTAGTLIENCLYSSISTIELTPGTYYVEGTQQGTQGANPTDPVAYWFSPPGSFSTLPEITSTWGVYTLAGEPGVLTFAGGSGEYVAYMGPNFHASDTAPSSTPEPGCALLLTGGLAGLLFWKRRRSSPEKNV
jgi:hypothetical protein